MKRAFFHWMIAALVFIAFGAGCATTVKKVVVQKNRNEHTWLQYEVTKGEIVKQGYDHPSTLTVEQIDDLLKAVHLEELSFFKWRDTGSVFVEEERQKLAPRLAEALAKASSDQWVHFAVTGHKRELIFETYMQTDGLCYIKDGKFNLVLGNVNYELIKHERDKYNTDPRERFVFNSRRLLANPAMGYDKPAIVADDRYLKKERRNWLVFDLGTFFTAVDAADQTPEPVQPAPTDTASRLEKLKQLLDQGLITQEEYEQKRQKILEEL